MAVDQKPYIRRAQLLLILGFVSIGVVGWGLGELGKNNIAIHEPFLTIAFLIPIVLIVAGAGIFIYGRMRKL
jgi:hypothetical protein